MMHDERDQQEQSPSSGKRSLLHRLWSRMKESSEEVAQDEMEEIPEEEPKSKPEPPPPPKVEVVANTVLYQMWAQWRASASKDLNKPINLCDDLKETDLPEYPEERLALLAELNKTAESISKKQEEFEKETEQARKDEKELPEAEPSNAILKIRVSKDLMRAWLFAFPPQGGSKMSLEMIQTELNSAGVTYGIDNEKLEDIAQNQLYYRVSLIAKGTPPVAGTDGWIEDCVSRTDEVDIKEKEDGSVNYKDMNLMRCVPKDAVLCRIIKPTDAVKGSNIKDRPIPGYNGKNPVIPKGENTVLSADGTELLSAIEGHVSFVGGKFKVKKQLVINGDVDNAVGNLDFVGDIMVFGDVREGFTIRAKGDICVDGSVEGASLYAGGSIKIKKGMNGNGKGLLSAQGNITCKYLENCTATAKETISVGSIVCCNISCNDKVQVLSDKGAIIGGTLTVLRLIEAKAIGSKSNRVTEIFLGYTPDMLNEKRSLETQVREAITIVQEYNKDIAYLEKVNAVTPNQERQDKLSALKLKRSIQLMQQDKVSKKLSQLNAEIDDLTACRVKSAVIYPFTKITIGGVSCTVQKTENFCNVFLAGDKVMIGSQ